MTAEQRQSNDKNATQVSQDLILWRLEGLETEVKGLRTLVNEVASNLKAYKAVMRFAVAVGSVMGGAVAFIADMFLRK